MIDEMISVSRPNRIFFYDAFMSDYVDNILMRRENPLGGVFLRTYRIPKYVMIEKGNYPIIAYSGDSSDSVRGELFAISDGCLEYVRRKMYQKPLRENLISIEDRQYILFTCTDMFHMLVGEWITSGNWRSYLDSKKITIEEFEMY